jgi:hypothetical protein
MSRLRARHRRSRQAGKRQSKHHCNLCPHDSISFGRLRWMNLHWLFTGSVTDRFARRFRPVNVVLSRLAEHLRRENASLICR